jgi:hypothetical protein
VPLWRRSHKSENLFGAVRRYGTALLNDVCLVGGAGSPYLRCNLLVEPRDLSLRYRFPLAIGAIKLMSHMGQKAKYSLRSAVGTVITDRPPPRSVRAEFPHTAPTLGE